MQCIIHSCSHTRPRAHKHRARIVMFMKLPEATRCSAQLQENVLNSEDDRGLCHLNRSLVWLFWKSRWGNVQRLSPDIKCVPPCGASMNTSPWLFDSLLYILLRFRSTNPDVREMSFLLLKCTWRHRQRTDACAHLSHVHTPTLTKSVG